MTTTTAFGIATDRYFARIVIVPSARVPTLGEFETLVGDLRSFLAVHAGAEMYENTSRLAGILTNPREMSSADRLKVATAHVENLEVTRLTMNSPLEVMFWLGSSTSFAYLLANRALKTFEHFQRARIQKAEADYQTAVYQSATSLLTGRLPPDSPGTLYAVQAAIAAGETALSSLRSFEVVAEDDLPPH